MRVQARFCILFALLPFILSLQTFPLSYNLEDNVNCDAVKIISQSSFGEHIKILESEKIILNAFHISEQRKPVLIDERKYFGFDENRDATDFNPTYDQAYRYQPSFSLRFGIEVSF